MLKEILTQLVNSVDDQQGLWETKSTGDGSSFGLIEFMSFFILCKLLAEFTSLLLDSPDNLKLSALSKSC